MLLSCSEVQCRFLIRFLSIFVNLIIFFCHFLVSFYFALVDVWKGGYGKYDINGCIIITSYDM